jgi:hypothetical protein
MLEIINDITEVVEIYYYYNVCEIYFTTFIILIFIICYIKLIINLLSSTKYK